MIPTETIIGVCAGVLGVSLYLPQIIKAYKTKHTMDIALWTYLLIFVNDCLWSAYGLVINNPFIYVANIISLGLCVVILVQKNRYDKLVKSHA